MNKVVEGMIAAIEAICEYLATCQPGQTFTLASLKCDVENSTPNLILDWGRNDKTRDSLSSACSKCITAFSNQGLLICHPHKTFEITEELIYLCADYSRFQECYCAFQSAAWHKSGQKWAEYGISGELAARCRIYSPEVKSFLCSMGFSYDLLVRRHAKNMPYFRKRQSMPFPRI